MSYDPTREAEATPWLIEGLWQRGKINGMAGYEKSGKSRLMNWLLVGLAQPTVLGLRVFHTPHVLYLAGEETYDTINQRLKCYAEQQGGSPHSLPKIDLMQAAAMHLERSSQRAWLSEKLARGGYDCLVMDPLRRLHGADENNSQTMADFYNDLRQWSNNAGLTVIFLHHTPKLNDLDLDLERIATWFRGTTDTAAIVDTAQYVWRCRTDRIELKRHGRFPPLEPLRVTDRTDAFGFEVYTGP